MDGDRQHLEQEKNTKARQQALIMAASVFGGQSSVSNRSDEKIGRSGSSSDVNGAVEDGIVEEGANQPPRRVRRMHRHSLQQVQGLERVFIHCPHPDEKQRLDLSRRLNMKSKQVKFWFQNRRTQMKMHVERRENMLLKEENNGLRNENSAIMEALQNLTCLNCSGPMLPGEVPPVQQCLLMENARLKSELQRLTAIIAKFPCPTLSPNASTCVGAGTNGAFGLGSNATPPFILESMSLASNGHAGRTVLVQHALFAMKELVKMAEVGDQSMWFPSAHAADLESLNYRVYNGVFRRLLEPSPFGFVVEATREIGIVMANGGDLVDCLMDPSRWSEMFPCIVAKASTDSIISSGMASSRNGLIQLMHAELRVISPLVPVREVAFLRFCKEHGKGLWAVVDVSVDGMLRPDGSTAHVNIQESHASVGYMGCKLLPSGCVIQDMNNGYCKVTWIVHAEYDESAVHQLYRPLIRSGQVLGARRWMASLQRQCQYLALMGSGFIPIRDPGAMTPLGRRCLLKLAQRMMASFCAGVCMLGEQIWWNVDGWRGKTKLGEGEEMVRMMTRQSGAVPGEPTGLVLSATATVWLPGMLPQHVFHYLLQEQNRADWDILGNGAAMKEMGRISKGQHPGNAVTVLRPKAATSGEQSDILVLQETCIDSSGMLLVYAPVDVQAMYVVMNGSDSAHVSLMPSGFAIFPDGRNEPPAAMPPNTILRGSSGGSFNNTNSISTNSNNTGSLVTVAHQILLMNSLPSANLTEEAVNNVGSLLSCTIKKIKSTVQANNGV